MGVSVSVTMLVRSGGTRWYGWTLVCRGLEGERCGDGTSCSVCGCYGARTVVCLLLRVGVLRVCSAVTLRAGGVVVWSGWLRRRGL